MKHVAPQRWADLWAGRVDEAERTALERHAAECPRCARERERVTRASDSFASIKQQPAPELAWDSVRARVHWSVSTERRAKVAQPSRRGWIAVGLTAAAGLATTLWIDRPSPPVVEPPVAVVEPRVEAPRTEPLVGLVNRTTGALMVDGIRRADPFASSLAAGNVIATDRGGVDIQFGDRSAFRLGPHSRLELVRFDSRAIELVVDGVIDVEVGPRSPEQRFTIRAGRREIEVRGTQFRVAHTEATTAVSCRHGLVAVRDAEGQQEVGATRRLVVPADQPVRSEPVQALTADEVADLAEAAPLSMPVWDLGTLANSAPLEIATSGRRAVRVDGVELGEAPMQVRVMPGRHTVETEDHHGRYRRAGWVDVTAGAKRPARVEVLPEPAPVPVRGIAERRRQLMAGIDRGRISACTRAAAKQGLLADAYVQIEISVDVTGAVNFLNVLDTDLSRKLSDCIEGVLREVSFRAGPAASWRERIEL